MIGDAVAQPGITIFISGFAGEEERGVAVVVAGDAGIAGV